MALSLSLSLSLSLFSLSKNSQRVDRRSSAVDAALARELAALRRTGTAAARRRSVGRLELELRDVPLERGCLDSPRHPRAAPNQSQDLYPTMEVEQNTVDLCGRGKASRDLSTMKRRRRTGDPHGLALVRGELRRNVSLRVRPTLGDAPNVPRHFARQHTAQSARAHLPPLAHLAQPPFQIRRWI